MDEAAETIAMRNISPVRYCRSCGGRLARDNTGEQCAPCRAKSDQATLHPPEVPAGFWDTEQMRDALASWHMGRVIHAYRHHPFHDRPLSQETVAAWLGITQAQLSRIEHGPPIRDLDRLIYWATLLRIPAASLWFDLPGAPRRWDDRPAAQETRAGRDHPAATVAMAALPASPRANSSNPSADALTMEAFRAADRQIGGGHLYASVVRYLQADLGPRLFGTISDDTGPQLFCAAAGLTDMAGWMAHDGGQDLLARQHFDRAMHLSELGGDRQLGAHVRTSLSHLQHHLGEPQEAIRFARDGQRKLGDRRGNPELAARLLAMEARGRAALGESAECARILIDAEKMLGHELIEAPSPWVSRFDEASLASEAARCLRQLGDLQAARRQAERVVALRSEERARSRAFGQLTLATILVEQGELDTACAVGYQAVDGTRAVGSFLVIQQLYDVRRLLEPHRSVRAVAEFLAYLREGIRGRAWLSQWPSVDPGCQTVGGDERTQVFMPSFETQAPTWQHLAEGNAKQARKRVAADVIVRDEGGRLLLVDPNYKPDWDLPGGMAEANEPPRQAASRELKEELGLEVPIGRLLCVDWVSPHGPWDDSLMFIFDCGELDTREISRLRLLDDELAAFRFFTKEDASALLRPYVWRRVEVALDALRTGQARYLEDGEDGHTVGGGPNPHDERPAGPRS
jgi:ADP-ribose pyrophosphatase YjhB (NUDIX family)/transcriptional regulator with XRE-family HTH domain